MQKPDSVPLPDELRAVSRPVLEEYVLARLRQFSRVFGSCLAADERRVEQAYGEALQYFGAADSSNLDNCIVRFKHRCRFLGCMNKECVLCKNNPNKRCRDDDNFDECYADCQILKSKCDADVHLEIVNSLTGLPQNIPGLELQVSVVDGESWSEATAQVTSNVRELLKSDEGQTLLASLVAGTKADGEGRLFLKLQEGAVRLPDLNITDKNDTFHMAGDTYSTFRLMARAIKRDLYGNAVMVDVIPPAISGKFIVKTQRALNDYRKSEYPHYKDELTKLRYIGSITAQRLREIQAHLGFDVPFTSIDTVEQLKHLMLYADQHRQVESKLLELLNMKGKHKQKWDYLRDILAEKIVYDDMVHRAWYADEQMTQGLLFPCKQGQVNIEKPVGMFRRLHQGGQPYLQVFTAPDAQVAETIKAWRQAAEQMWCTPSHNRWAVVHEPMDLVNASGPSSTMVPGGAAAASAAAPMLRTMSGGMSVVQQHQDQGDETQDVSMDRPSASASHGLTTPDMGPGAVAAAAAGGGSGAQLPQFFVMSASPSASSLPAGGAGVPPGAAGGGGVAGGSSGAVPPPDPFRQSLDPVTGAFKFTAAGPGAVGGPAVSSTVGGVPSPDPMMMSDMYRTGSAPQAIHPSMLTSRQSTGSTGLDMGGAAGPMMRPHRNVRYRRMSADAVGNAHAQQQLQQQAMQQQMMQQQQQQQLMAGLHLLPQQRLASVENYYDQSAFDMVLKRPRSSAPSGLYPPPDDMQSMAAAQHLFASSGQQMDKQAMDRIRLNMYHIESQGRHLPRSRTSMDNLAAVAEPPPIASVFDHPDLDIDQLLHGISAEQPYGGGAGGMKQQQEDMMMMGMAAGPGGQQQQQQGQQGMMGQQQQPLSLMAQHLQQQSMMGAAGGLAAAMQQHQQQQQQGTASPVMMHQQQSGGAGAGGMQQGGGGSFMGMPPGQSAGMLLGGMHHQQGGGMMSAVGAMQQQQGSGMLGGGIMPSGSSMHHPGAMQHQGMPSAFAQSMAGVMQQQQQQAGSGMMPGGLQAATGMPGGMASNMQQAGMQPASIMTAAGMQQGSGGGLMQQQQSGGGGGGGQQHHQQQQLPGGGMHHHQGVGGMMHSSGSPMPGGGGGGGGGGAMMQGGGGGSAESSHAAPPAASWQQHPAELSVSMQNTLHLTDPAAGGGGGAGAAQHTGMMSDAASRGMMLPFDSSESFNRSLDAMLQAAPDSMKPMLPLSASGNAAMGMGDAGYDLVHQAHAAAQQQHATQLQSQQQAAPSQQPRTSGGAS